MELTWNFTSMYHFTLCITRKAQQGGSLERPLFVHIQRASKLITKRGHKDGRNVQKN